jgi:PAS domain S-box-containing protein
MPDAAVAVDRRGRITHANEPAEALFGYRRDDLLGQPVERLLPDDLRAAHIVHRGGYFAHPRRRPMGAGLELTARRADGGRLPVEISLSPVELGDEPLVIAVIRDITERARLHAREHEARRAAQAAARQREEFLSIAAHEFRTPLTTLNGSVQALARQVGSPVLDRGRLTDLQASLQRQVDRLERLVADLLDLTRLQHDGSAHRRRRVDLADLAREALGRFEDIAADPERRRLVLDAPEPVVGSWDADRLDRALTNLISNALKYSPDGGEVRVRVRRVDGRAEAAVSDRGIGIAPEEQARLFQPFARGRHGHPGIEGAGLGLYIAAQIVERHGGAIAVESEPGAGSTFTIRLPLAADGGSPPTPGDEASGGLP